MRASKRDAAKFIRSAVRAGWSRAVETSRKAVEYFLHKREISFDI